MSEYDDGDREITTADILWSIEACDDSVSWAENWDEPREAWEACDRGDWMIWLAARLGVDRDIVADAIRECILYGLPELDLPHCCLLDLDKLDKLPDDEIYLGYYALATVELMRRGRATAQEVRGWLEDARKEHTEKYDKEILDAIEQMMRYCKSDGADSYRDAGLACEAVFCVARSIALRKCEYPNRDAYRYRLDSGMNELAQIVRETIRWGEVGAQIWSLPICQSQSTTEDLSVKN